MAFSASDLSTLVDKVWGWIPADTVVGITTGYHLTRLADAAREGVSSTSGIDAFFDNLLRRGYGNMAADVYEAMRFGAALFILGGEDEAAQWFVDEEDLDNLGYGEGTTVTMDHVCELLDSFQGKQV